MKKPNVVIHDVQTNEVIVRAMTDDEFALYKAERELEAQVEAEAEAKAASKAALLERLGITEDEAKLLLA